MHAPTPIARRVCGMLIPAAVSTDFSCHSQCLRHSIRNIVLTAVAVLAIDTAIGFIRSAASSQPSRTRLAPTPVSCGIGSMLIPASRSANFSSQSHCGRVVGGRECATLIRRTLASFSIDTTLCVLGRTATREDSTITILAPTPLTSSIGALGIPASCC